MKNTFGTSVSVTLWGESHGASVGAVLDGLAPGIVVSIDDIVKDLKLRAPVGNLSTQRQERDEVKILSGVFENKTTGTPLSLLIPNEDTHSRDYAATRFLARPGHADYTAYCKYHGFEDYRGGGHFSGRITAALVAAGAICKSALRAKGIVIGTHIKRCAGIDDRDFSTDPTRLAVELEQLQTKQFAVLDEAAGIQMQQAILRAREDKDSVGGILQTVVTGMPAGVGEPWFDSVESCLSHMLFGIPALKGVSFGDGFALADMRGSEANDSFYRTENGTAATYTNHNGGINGGITNGMPLCFSCVIKPTASIYQTQQTIDMRDNTDTKITIHGRHDPAIVHRARAVVDACTAIVLCDLLAQRFGTDTLSPVSHIQ